MQSLVVGLWSLVLGWSALLTGSPSARGSAIAIPITPVISPRSVPAHSGSWDAEFEIENTTAQSRTVTLTCGGTMALCSSADASVTLAPAEVRTLTVHFTTGNINASGSLRLLGSSPGILVNNSPMTIVVGPSMIRMTGPGPDASATQTVHRTRPLLRADFVLPTGEVTDTNSIAIWWKGQKESTGALRRNAAMLEWEVPAELALAVGDTATFKVRHCLVSGVCTEESRIVQLPADQKPALDFTTMPFEGSGGGFSAPFGPGVALSGAEVETGLATPAYMSMGAARSAGLVYSTRTSYPRALIATNVTIPWGTGAGDSLWVTLRDSAGVSQGTVSGPTSACKTGALFVCRTVLQADYAAASVFGVKVFLFTVEVMVKSGATTRITTDTVRVPVVDRRNSPYGTGWWPANGARLYSAGTDRILVGASGAATIYRSNNDTLYLPTPGSRTNLFRTASGWELRTRGTTAKVVFDTGGRVIKGVDASGNRDSVSYDSAGRVVTLTDPRNKTIALYYSGSTGRLDSIVSLPTYAGGRRVTRILIDTLNHLVTDSLRGSGVRWPVTNYAYHKYGSVPGTALLERRWGIGGADSVHIVYDTISKSPTQARLLAATVGGTVPVVQYRAFELQGWKSFRSLDSLYVEVTDPRGNWTRSRLSRWGQAELTWDAIGTLGRSQYDRVGRVLWSEGKNGDSSRVYSSYDSLGRVTRSYIVRAANDTLWLSRLTYDGNDRVVKRLDSRGLADSAAYDGAGRLVYTRDPAGAVTRFKYTSDGLLDSTLAPLDTAWSYVTFDTVWRQPFQAYNQLRQLVAETVYDSMGRVKEGRGRQAKSQDGGGVHYAWSSGYRYYGRDNLPDSSRAGEWGGCSDNDTLCTAPAGAFTVNARSAQQYDQAGRDTLVIQWSGNKAVRSRVRYDRLGRVVVSWPHADSAHINVRDSMIYDLAGNVTSRVTRRGFTITSAYDSRNRDTSTVIPGVGTLRRSFGGPNDQLTRLWLDGAPDPVGGVNGARAWVYDARGRLLVDSLWTGSTGRAMRYRYDGYERVDSANNGVLGRRYWFKGDRRQLARIATSAGDTLDFFYDDRGRLIADTLRAPTAQGGKWLGKTQTYRETGELESRVLSVGGWASESTFVAGASGPVGMLAEGFSGPALQTQYVWDGGLGQATQLEEDFPEYDAHRRLQTWEGFKSDSASWVESYGFDQAGNLDVMGETRIHDSATNRLLSRVADSVRSDYTYDLAGNLVARLDSRVDSAGSLIFRCSWQYDYDALDRMTEVRAKATAEAAFTLVARYGYDVLGQRIARRVYATTCAPAPAPTVEYVRYAVWEGQVQFETDSVGTTVGRQYFWGPGTDDLRAATDPSDGKRYFAITDKLGSVRAWVSQAGVRGGGWRYSPYGTTLTVSGGVGTHFPYRWTGREYDGETGFYFNRARYYDPKQGRFTQEDPIGLAGGRNLYAYVDGQPLEARDPSGLLPIGDRYRYPVMGVDEDYGPPSSWDGWIGFWGSLLPVYGRWEGGQFIPMNLSSAQFNEFQAAADQLNALAGPTLAFSFSREVMQAFLASGQAWLGEYFRTGGAPLTVGWWMDGTTIAQGEGFSATSVGESSLTVSMNKPTGEVHLTFEGGANVNVTGVPGVPQFTVTNAAMSLYHGGFNAVAHLTAMSAVRIESRGNILWGIPWEASIGLVPLRSGFVSFEYAH